MISQHPAFLNITSVSNRIRNIWTVVNKRNSQQMSRETDTTQVVNNIPRTVSLCREDSGYLSIIGTPAGTPCVINGRKMSRTDPPRDPTVLKGIPEGCPEIDQQVPSIISHRGL